MGSQVYGTLLYLVATIIVMSFFAAKDKIALEDKMKAIEEKIEEKIS